MKRLLVTGGAGFIGSHITESLVRKKYFVRVLDNLSTGRRKNLRGVVNKIDFIKGDIRSKQICLRVTKNIDCILHQAALRSVPGSFNNPDNYNQVNIQGTLNLLKAAVRQKVKVFVFASSSSVYGETKTFPEKETFIPRPMSPYSLSKLAGEYYCRVFSYRYGLRCVSLRYFNVFGPRQSLDNEYAVVIPRFISSMLNNERPPIYGTGKQSRDFIYVSDVVRANILALQKANLKDGVFNIASGKDCSILKLVSILNKLMHKDIKPLFLNPRPGDAYRTLADLSRSRDILGFKPEINFSEGLRLTLEYFKEKWQKKP